MQKGARHSTSVMSIIGTKSKLLKYTNIAEISVVTRHFLNFERLIYFLEKYKILERIMPVPRQC
jgi:hypothetical protein